MKTVFVDVTVFLRSLADDDSGKAVRVEAHPDRAAEGEIRLLTTMFVLA